MVSLLLQLEEGHGSVSRKEDVHVVGLDATAVTVYSCFILPLFEISVPLKSTFRNPRDCFHVNTSTRSVPNSAGMTAGCHVLGAFGENEATNHLCVCLSGRNNKAYSVFLYDCLLFPLLFLHQTLLISVMLLCDFTSGSWSSMSKSLQQSQKTIRRRKNKNVF